ncbi:MAG: ABC transporter substrate-binding protein, partial [Actinomycetota bacterium]|nr:ABC transporter substrate-binding protein [Actinomycetota bacterium]
AAAERLVVVALVPRLGPRERDFERRFRARYGHAPHHRAVLGYAAMQVVLQAIARAGADASSRPAVIREALRVAEEPRAEFAPFRIVGSRLVRARSEL